MKTTKAILKERFKDLQHKGYKVLYIGLYGSQNYNLHDEKSDVDCRAIVMPSLKDIVRRKKISVKYTYTDGDTDVKDLLTYTEILQKGNLAFIEPLQSAHYIYPQEQENDFLRSILGKTPINLRAVLGMMVQKQKAFRHPYPSKTLELETWGYDPKQITHIYRLFDLLNLTLAELHSKSFVAYDESSGKQLKRMKRNTHNIVESITQGLPDEAISNIIETSTQWLNDYTYKPIDYTDIVIDFLTEEFKKELSAYEI